MKSLTRIFTPKVFYIKNDVIYKISNVKNETDKCVVVCDEENCPKITVDGQNWYFIDWIDVGDTYTDESGFTKTIHGTGDTESGCTFPNYYRDCCVVELEKLICDSNYTEYATFKEFLRANRTVYPVYMLQDLGYTVEGVEQIDFSESKFMESLENEIIRRAKKAANDVVRSYDYHVTDSSIEIEKNE